MCIDPTMNIIPGLPFLNIYNPFTNENISMYLVKHCRRSLDTMDYFNKQISHLSKCVVIAASAYCQLCLTQHCVRLMFKPEQRLYFCHTARQPIYLNSSVLWYISVSSLVRPAQFRDHRRGKTNAQIKCY